MKSANLIVLIRDGHQYIFIFEDRELSKLILKLHEYASDPELSFTWTDAQTVALFSQKMVAKTNG